MPENRRIVNLLRQFDPSDRALLDWLRPHVDDSLLQEIAIADYSYEAREHFEALKPIRDRQQIPVPLQWIPREVLELMRYSEPLEIDTPGHLMRAFSCAILLKAANDPETLDYILNENTTLIQLIASVLYLGHEASESALRFLCWRVLRLSDDYDEAPFFALALLLLRAAIFDPHQDGADLSLLADWVVEEERRVRRGPMAMPNSEDWLLGLTYFDSCHEAWRRVTRQVLLNPAKSFPDPAATAMREIVKRLVHYGLNLPSVKRPMPCP